jgi:hypothetical protein
VSFLREEARRPEAGPVVLRSREIETIDRHRRSPSPRYEEVLVRRPRSQSTHAHEHERTKSRTRYVEKERVRKVSPSPAPKPQMVRYVERRPRSPSPVQRDRIRIVDKRREASSSSSSSSSSEDAPPSKIRAPTIERDVITHYRGIDHGMFLLSWDIAWPVRLTKCRCCQSGSPKPASPPPFIRPGTGD